MNLRGSSFTFVRTRRESLRVGWKIRGIVGLVVGLIVGITLVGSEAFGYWMRTGVFPIIEPRKDVSVGALFVFLPVFTACGGIVGVSTIRKPALLRYALIGGILGALGEAFASVASPLRRSYLPVTTILDERTVMFALLGAGGGVLLWGLGWVRRSWR